MACHNAVERSARSSGAPSESRALAEAAAGKRLPVTMSCHPLTLEVVSLPVDRAPAEMPICTVTQLPACRTCIGNTRLLPCIRRHGVLSRLRKAVLVGSSGTHSVRSHRVAPDISAYLSWIVLVVYNPEMCMGSRFTEILFIVTSSGSSHRLGAFEFLGCFDRLYADGG